MQPLAPTGAPKHAPRRIRRWAGLVPVLCVLALAGCKTLEGVNHPFQSEPPPAPIAEIATSPTVMVAPVAGPPPEVGRVMAELVADSLRQRDVLAVTRNPPSGSMLLSGRSELVPQSKDHALLRVSWSLTQADGLTAGTFESEETVPVVPGEDPYQRLAASTMVPFADRVAFKVADQVQALPKQTQTASLTAPPGAETRDQPAPSAQDSAQPAAAETADRKPSASAESSADTEAASAASAPASPPPSEPASASTTPASQTVASAAPASGAEQPAASSPTPEASAPPQSPAPTAAGPEAGSAPASAPEPLPADGRSAPAAAANGGATGSASPLTGAALAGAVASGATASAASVPRPAPSAVAAPQPPASESSPPAAPTAAARAPLTAVPVSTPPASVPAASVQAAPTAMSILVAPVQGAPGDGNQTLTDAIKRMLQRNGVAVTDYSTPETLVLHGRVTVTPAAMGMDDVQLEWTVYDAAGRFFGTVSQRNRLTREQAEGHWAETAMLAASGAVNGIRSLIAQAAGSARVSSR